MYILQTQQIMTIAIETKTWTHSFLSMRDFKLQWHLSNLDTCETCTVLLNEECWFIEGAWASII